MIAALSPFTAWILNLAQSRGDPVTVPVFRFVVLVAGLIWRLQERTSEAGRHLTFLHLDSPPFTFVIFQRFWFLFDEN